MSDDVNQILNAVPIESFIGKYISLKRKGKNFWGVCPFHSEKSPSLSVSPEKGIFKCFGCGAAGNVIGFIQRYEKTSFGEALKILADYAGITLTYKKNEQSFTKEKDHKIILAKINEWVKGEYQKQFKESPEAKTYINERKLKPETIQYFEIGYAPPTSRFLETKLHHIYKDNIGKEEEARKACNELGLIDNTDSQNSYNRFKGRLIFPIYDIKGNICAFGGRIIYKSETSAKYINSPESILFSKKDTLYNLYQSKEVIRRDGQIILVEGYLDVIGLYQINIKNAVAPLGTSFTEEQAKLIKRYADKIIIFFDSDKAGIEASFRAMVIARAQKLNIKIVIHDGEHGKDPFDLAQKLDDIDLLTLLDNAKDEISFCLWYYFSYKFDLSNITDKKKSIEEVFEYIHTNIEQNWEKLEYLNSIADALNVPIETVKADFKQSIKKENKPFLSSNKYSNIPEEQTVSKKIKPSIIEKNILVYLLRIPKLWGEADLLDEMIWSSSEMELLFYFFKDRLLSGEIWNWEHLKEAMSILPNNLAELLSEIVIQFDEDFDDINLNIESIDEQDIIKKMKKDIYNIKLNNISQQLNNIQTLLKSKESIQENDQVLIEQITYLLELKQTTLKKLENLSSHKVNKDIENDTKVKVPFLEKMKTLSQTKNKN